MSESFKSFFDMKYQNGVFAIKGIGGTIVLFISPFVEKIIKLEKPFTKADQQLLVITALLIVLVAYLTFNLGKIVKEYAETLRIYYSNKP